MNSQNYVFQVEIFLDGECSYDRLYWSQESADKSYNTELRRLRKTMKLDCAMRKGHGADEEERLHVSPINDKTFIRLTVRKIEP